MASVVAHEDSLIDLYETIIAASEIPLDYIIYNVSPIGFSSNYLKTVG